MHGRRHLLAEYPLADIPQLLVLLAQQDDCPRRLHVERAWDVLDRRGDDLVDPVVGYGALVRQFVQRAPGLDGREECVCV